MKMHHALLLGSSVLGIALLPLLVLFSLEKPALGEIALVIAPPWKGGTTQVAHLANVPQVSPEQALFGGFVEIEDQGATDRLYGSGAWIVVKGQRLAEICGI